MFLLGCYKQSMQSNEQVLCLTNERSILKDGEWHQIEFARRLRQQRVKIRQRILQIDHFTQRIVSIRRSGNSSGFSTQTQIAGTPERANFQPDIQQPFSNLKTSSDRPDIGVHKNSPCAADRNRHYSMQHYRCDQRSILDLLIIIRFISGL